VRKSDFVDRVADRSGLTREEADKAVGAFLDTIEEVLARGGEVSFTGTKHWCVHYMHAQLGLPPR
jgi:DNA-binding protein HU-beta